MKTFLDFLNQADAAELVNTPGVGPTLAGRIIAARPFENIEDSLTVSGLGEKMLQRLRDSFDQMETDTMSEETGLAPTQPPASEPVQPPAPKQPEPAPAAKTASQSESRHPGKTEQTFFRRLGSAFVGFLKFIFVLLVIALLVGGFGAALYFGLPYLYQSFVVPVDQNRERIAEVAQQQARDVLALNAQIDELNAEIRSLKSEIESLQNRDDEFEAQLAAIETAIEAQNVSLASLEEMQSRLAQAVGQQREGLNAELVRQMQLTRVIDLLSRARLYLSQSNFGQARQDVALARDLLLELRDASPEAERATYNAALFRLSLALANLPGFPVIAVDDLNIAWNLLVLGEPDNFPEAGTSSEETP
jgi:TolA-binding protein